MSYKTSVSIYTERHVDYFCIVLSSHLIRFVVIVNLWFVCTSDDVRWFSFQSRSFEDHRGLSRSVWSFWLPVYASWIIHETVYYRFNTANLWMKEKYSLSFCFSLTTTHTFYQPVCEVLLLCVCFSLIFTKNLSTGFCIYV